MDHAKSTADALRSENERATAAQYALSILGKTQTEQDRLNGRFALAQQLADRFGISVSKVPDYLLAARDAADQAEQQLKFMAANYDELRQAGGQVVDTLFNPSNWKNWGDAGKSIIREVEQELLKLAIINPLKNMLEGSGGAKLPTLSSLFGLFGHNASGTESWSGGLTWLNENGKELVDLPAGSKIHNAADTRRMLATGNDNGGGRVVHNHFTGNLLTPEFWAQINAGDQASAVQGAHGGAQMSGMNA